MSGHSKWSTIKRKKGVADAKRGAIFTRLAREIAIAAREGGSDIDSNFRLRLAVDKARSENMPKENIERAIKRGAGEDKDSSAFEEITIEGYGPHGSALMVNCVTDNRNRTIPDIRHALTKAGCNMAEPGAVAWQFDRQAYFAFPASEMSFERSRAAAASQDEHGREMGQLSQAKDKNMDASLVELNQKIETLTAQMAYLTEQAEIAERQRQERTELIRDLTPIANQAFRMSIEQLEEIQEYIDLVDLLRFVKRVFATGRNFETLLDQLESLMDLVETVSPLADHAFGKAVDTLAEMEQKGYFALGRGGMRLAENVVTSFTEEDVNRLKVDLYFQAIIQDRNGHIHTPI